eukprot:12597132-Alexandrium_andersonii.AAC.1
MPILFDDDHVLPREVGHHGSHGSRDHLFPSVDVQHATPDSDPQGTEGRRDSRTRRTLQLVAWDVR